MHREGLPRQGWLHAKSPWLRGVLVVVSLFLIFFSFFRLLAHEPQSRGMGDFLSCGGLGVTYLVPLPAQVHKNSAPGQQAGPLVPVVWPGQAGPVLLWPASSDVDEN